MSESDDAELLASFVAIAQEAAAMGPVSFRGWTSNPEKYLRAGGKHDLPIDSSLCSFEPSELEKIASVVEFFSHMSVQYLVKALEDGSAGFTFTLTMQHDASARSVVLVNDQQDRNLQGLV